MLKKDVENPQLTVTPAEQVPAGQGSLSIVLIALCTLAFIMCFLVSMSVLRQFSGTSTYVPIGSHFTDIGIKLLRSLGLRKLVDVNLAFIVITGFEFAIYGLGALIIQRQISARENYRTFLFIWPGAVMAGALLVVTQALISGDMFVYADYGRTIVAHGANPYFVAPAVFAHDPITRLDDWRDVTAAYGPLWLGFSSLIALIAGTSATDYLLLFRISAFAAHLVNIVLVTAILRTQGRSSRTVTLGAFLYAWNPLLILESCLSGHNDVFMITLILLGVLFCARAEQHAFARPLHYLPPVIAFTLAGLIKFTALPLAALYLILLARKTLYGTSSAAFKSNKLVSWQWKPAFLKVLYTGITSGLVIVLLYGPFFIGHSIPDIINSFLNPPSSHLLQHSIMKAFVEGVGYHGMPAQNSWLYAVLTILTTFKVWSTINMLVVLSGLVVGAMWLWRTPTTRTLVLSSIAILGPLLIVTTWFFPWYVTWLVALAAVSLPISRQRIARALFAFALVFSASARLTYLSIGQVDPIDWHAIGCAATMIPPILAFLICLFISRKSWKPTLPDSDAAITTV
ncbi:MAG: hypothetical protein ACJ788_15090 [Ktedonobacteraceae bacterium]